MSQIKRHNQLEKLSPYKYSSTIVTQSTSNRVLVSMHRPKAPIVTLIESRSVQRF
jgi:hypothetical protein